MEEITSSSLPWYRRRKYQAAFIIFSVAAMIWCGQRVYKELTMPPVFVYLIPEEFIGPVYVFFDQKGGLIPQADPLGQAVHVPENGVVKLAGSVDALLRSGDTNKRPEAMVSIGKNGDRRIMSIFAGTYRDSNGELVEAYMDASDKLHVFPVPPNPAASSPAQKKSFYYLSDTQLDQRSIFNKEGCSHQGFVEAPGKIRSGEVRMQEAGVPSCAKFLVASPKEVLAMPKWLWEEPSSRLYKSIDEFIEEANERVEKTRRFYFPASHP